MMYINRYCHYCQVLVLCYCRKEHWLDIKNHFCTKHRFSSINILLCLNIIVAYNYSDQNYSGYYCCFFFFFFSKLVAYFYYIFLYIFEVTKMGTFCLYSSFWYLTFFGAHIKRQQLQSITFISSRLLSPNNAVWPRNNWVVT